LAGHHRTGNSGDASFLTPAQKRDILCNSAAWYGPIRTLNPQKSVSGLPSLAEKHFAKLRLMVESLSVVEQRVRGASSTLGDVLYASSKARASERDWANLIESIAAGDQVALHALYERANRIVFTLCVRLTANPEMSEELTIDVFHDVWRRAGTYDPRHGTVIAWIMNQVRSRAIDRLRFESRKKRTQVPDLDMRPNPEADPCDVLEMREQGQLLRAALAALTPDEREAIETAFFGGLTYAEAASRLNQPMGTVKTRIRSGLQKLRNSLSAEVGEP
jgi:RNA polymerase sigma-70 factor, ECF subfamily